MNMPPVNTFCYNELTTRDSDACAKFYAQLFGWQTLQTPMAGTTYTMFRIGERDVGGMIQMTPEWGEMPSHWMPYIAVEDVDATVQRVSELGGKVCVPPSDIPNIGRFAVITDPGGAVFSIIKLLPHK
jgi:predicted enzyme related to lactoylglutathione lyase